MCCNLTAEHLCRVIAVELVDSFIILTYVVATDTRYRGSMSLSLEEDVGIGDRGTRTLDRTTPSYIDDLACLVIGDNEEQNRRKLEGIAKTAFGWGDSNAVAFDDLKTELIHFHRRRHTEQCPVTLPNGAVIKPSSVIRMLGLL